MKKNLIKIAGILLLVILQLSLFTKFSVYSFGTNLIFVLCFALLFKGLLADSFLVAVIGGLFLDLTSPLHFGTYSIILIAFLLIINFVVLKNMPAMSLPFVFTFTFVLFVAIDLLFCLITRTIPGWQILLDGLLNGTWIVIVYLVLDKFIKQKEISVNI